MSREKKIRNQSGIPDYAIEAVARCLLPDLLAFYGSEEGQKEFEEWLLTNENSKLKEENYI